MATTDAPPAGTGCPSRSDLIAFSQGRLPAETLGSVSTHLSGCPTCSSALSEFDDPDGQVGSALRPTSRAGRLEPLTTEPEYQRMAARARRLRPDLPVDVPIQLGSYRLGERIGGGGMGTVYRAFHTRLKKWVALKVVRADRLDDPRSVARFHREMEAVGRLDHPNVIRATDAGEHDGTHFLVMDLVDGVDLARVVRRTGPLPVGAACEAARQAAEALEAAHRAGLVHRDVKPSNLLLSVDGQVKLLDLGLARLGDGQSVSDGLTGRGHVMGTADYMAPEQWEAGHTVDIRADLYSLGCTLFTCLTGDPPFGGPEYDSSARKMTGHLHHAPPNLRTIRPEVPAGLASVVVRLLAKDPAKRYATPMEVAQAVAPFAAAPDLAALARMARSAADDPGLATSTVTAAAQVPTRTLRAPARRRRRRWVAGVAVLLIAATGVIAWQFGGAILRPRSPDRPAPSPPGPVAGEWFDMLRQQPDPLIWPNRQPDARWQYDADRRDLWVNSPERCVFGLGNVPDVPFDVEVTISQVPWVGAVGVFVRGQPAAAGRDAHMAGDLVWLTRVGPADDPGSGRLVRAVLLWYPERNQCHTEQNDSDPIPRFLVPEHTMRLTVGPDGPTAVTWDGAAAGARLFPPPPDPHRAGGPGGIVGLIAEGSNVVIKAARLRIHPPGETP